MHKTSDHDVVLGASESEQLAVRMLAEAYKRVPVGDRNWLPTCKIDCRQVLQVGLECCTCAVGMSTVR